MGLIFKPYIEQSVKSSSVFQEKIKASLNSPIYLKHRIKKKNLGMKDIISALFWNLLLLFISYLTPFKAMERYHILKCLTYFKRFAIGSLLKLHFLFFVFFFLIYFFLLFPLGICRSDTPLPSQILPKQNKALSLSNQSEKHFPLPFPVTCWFPVEQERRLCYSVYQRPVAETPCFLQLRNGLSFHPQEVGGAREVIWKWLVNSNASIQTFRILTLKN